MGSSRGTLSPLQAELLEAFFALEQRFFLTGGSALAGFHLGHRQSQDLDLFAAPPMDLELGQRALEQAARSVGAQATAQVSYAEFRRLLVTRGAESTLVDLVIDRAPQVEPDKPRVGRILVDSLREIAANKVCTLIGRCEIRDLVDLRAILQRGIRLEDALRDAARKDGGANAATLAWLLDQLVIAHDAVVPGGVSGAELDAFRRDLVVRLRKLALPDGKPPGP